MKTLQSDAHLPSDLLWPPFLKLQLVHGPNGPLHILNSYKTLVKTEVVANCILRLQKN